MRITTGRYISERFKLLSDLSESKRNLELKKKKKKFSGCVHVSPSSAIIIRSRKTNIDLNCKIGSTPLLK